MNQTDLARQTGLKQSHVSKYLKQIKQGDLFRKPILKDDVKIKDDIFRYLGYRAQTSAWKEQFQQAAKNYIQSNTNIRVFGFLVRDVEPNQDDLRIRVDKLAKDQHADMEINLLALYLPLGSIGQLSNKVVSSRDGGVV